MVMSPELIRYNSEQAALKAAERKQTPFVFWDEAEVEKLSRQIPFIGDYVPDGWERKEKLFVDSSGFGEKGEAALTYSEFCEKVRGYMKRTGVYGYAITEAGQFQVYIGVYKKGRSH